jgi:hypothetical protein
MVLLMRNTVALGMCDIDAALLQIPVVGEPCEAFSRKETYYWENIPSPPWRSGSPLWASRRCS